jgi:hypothetical protein
LFKKPKVFIELERIKQKNKEKALKALEKSNAVKFKAANPKSVDKMDEIDLAHQNYFNPPYAEPHDTFAVALHIKYIIYSLYHTIECRHSHLLEIIWLL